MMREESVERIHNDNDNIATKQEKSKQSVDRRNNSKYLSS